MKRRKRNKLRQLDNDHLQCRLMYTHAWTLVDASELQIQSSFVGKHKQGFICLRCGAERLDVWNYLGELMHRRYEYPEGYLVAKEDKPSVKEVRQEYMRRLH